MTSLAEIATLFSLPFIQNAFLMAILASIPAALLSCFAILKGWSLVGDAVSHAALPGLIIAYLFSVPLALGALVFGLAAALLPGYLSAAQGRIRRDVALGVVYSGLFGLGLVLMVKIESPVHFDHILFGDLLGAAAADLWGAAFAAILVILFVVLRGRDLALFIFDPVYARAIGIRTRLLHYGLLTLLALTAVIAMKAAGAVLAVAFLIAPGAVGLLLFKNFNRLLLFAPLFSAFCSITGVALSLAIDSAPAPTIVMIMSLCLVAALALRQKRPAPLEVEEGAVLHAHPPAAPRSFAQE